MFLRDPSTKKVILWCWDRFIPTTPVNEIMESMRVAGHMIAMKTNCEAVFPSILFAPALENYWNRISNVNLFARNLNISMRRSPLSSHKATLKKVKGFKQLCCRGDSWQEKKDGTG